MKQIIEKIPGYDTLVLPIHKFRALRAAAKYKHPAKGLKVIGVTGTNGKTSTCYFIHRMLREAGLSVGLMTTVAWGINDDITPQVAHMTTVNPKLLNKRLKEIADAGCEYLVFELTSHALSQYRAHGIPIDIAVMTNVTHEHLDYHKTFERYRDAKRKMFKLANTNESGQRLGIINADDASAKLFAKDVEYRLTYGVDHGQLRATDIKLTGSQAKYTAVFGDEKLKITSHIPGIFSVYNSLAAIAVGLSYGLTNEQIEKGIAALKSVEGRMERIDLGQDFDVVVDFAHTPDAFELLFSGIKSKGRIITLFGSAGGRRDPAKRPIQGEIAGKYSDIVILTEEDDRDTPGMDILGQIAKGAEKSGKTPGKDLFLVLDRPSAIELAFSLARSGDLVLLLGKGHEKTIERADGEHPYLESDEAIKALKKLKKARK